MDLTPEGIDALAKVCREHRVKRISVFGDQVEMEFEAERLAGVSSPTAEEIARERKRHEDRIKNWSARG